MAKAGRPVGRKGIRSRELADKLKKKFGGKFDPVLYMCKVAADPKADTELRLYAASLAAPYLYPRVQTRQKAIPLTPKEVIDALEQEKKPKHGNPDFRPEPFRPTPEPKRNDYDYDPYDRT